MRAFSRDDTAQRDAFSRLIPADASVDVLVTHSPPHNVLDSFLGQHTGSQALADVLAERQRCGVAPSLHVFGHVHKQRGVVAPGAAAVGAQGATLPETTFVNAASVTGHTLRPHPAVVIDVPADSLRAPPQ